MSLHASDEKTSLKSAPLFAVCSLVQHMTKVKLKTNSLVHFNNVSSRNCSFTRHEEEQSLLKCC